MTQRDYEHISAEIEKKSGIVISGITIKRLSNGAFSRSPQIATLNAFGQQTSNKKDRNNLKDRQSNLTCYFLTYCVIWILSVIPKIVSNNIVTGIVQNFIFR